MDRYGEAIEYDLHDHFGLDLLDFFRGRYSWRKLHALVTRLPQASHFGQALAEDEDNAQRLLALSDSDLKATASGPRVADYRPEVALLGTAVELLQVVCSRIEWLGTQGTKSADVVPVPRPETALDRLRERRRTDRLTGLIAEVQAAQRRAAVRPPDGL